MMTKRRRIYGVSSSGIMAFRSMNTKAKKTQSITNKCEVHAAVEGRT
jgi:hypothetical protein